MSKLSRLMIRVTLVFYFSAINLALINALYYETSMPLKSSIESWCRWSPDAKGHEDMAFGETDAYCHRGLSSSLKRAHFTVRCKATLF